MLRSPPFKITKKAEKQMRREKTVGAGKEYAPTLYTVLVNPDDDRRLFGMYPTSQGKPKLICVLRPTKRAWSWMAHRSCASWSTTISSMAN